MGVRPSILFASARSAVPLSPHYAEEATMPDATPICEGCHGFGGNWSCDGENDPEDCECEYCTGNEDCPECGGHGEY